MGKEVTYKLKRGSQLSEEEIAMIEAAKSIDPVYDEDNLEIDPASTPEQFKALMQAVAERNRRIARRERERGLA